MAVGGGAELDRDIFSKEWIDKFRLGEPGFCERALEYYEWRVAGWGSNMNCKCCVRNGCFVRLEYE